LNIIIIKNHYPLFLIQEILAWLSRAKIYTKLDIIIVFNRIRITKEQEYLTAFNIRYGLYETLVILFGLSNVSVIFQTRINKVLYLYLDVFCITYIDDILVYSNDLTSYK
jgi:Reverse transcriptase (RNA-dependent DNA polymerase)